MYLKTLPKLESLKLLYNYNLETGILTNRITNKSPTYINNSGYLVVAVGPKQYLVHRIIYKLFYEEEPFIIDHIDKDKLNNRIANLRNGNYVDNARNRNTSSYSGIRGITYVQNLRLWRVRISVDGKEITIGCFLSKEHAQKARLEAENKYWQHSNVEVN